MAASSRIFESTGAPVRSMISNEEQFSSADGSLSQIISFAERFKLRSFSSLGKVSIDVIRQFAKFKTCNIEICRREKIDFAKVHDGIDITFVPRRRAARQVLRVRHYPKDFR